MKAFLLSVVMVNTARLSTVHVKTPTPSKNQKKPLSFLKFQCLKEKMYSLQGDYTLAAHESQDWEIV